MHLSASSTNFARVYNLELAQSGVEPSRILRPEHVLDGFFLHALLADKTRNKGNEVLHLPHGGEQSQRLRSALEERNTAMQGTGQDKYAHFCFGCTVVGEKNGVHGQWHKYSPC